MQTVASEEEKIKGIGGRKVKNKGLNIISKHRKRKLYGKLKKHVGEIIRQLCRRREIELMEGHPMPDYIHMCVSIPHKHSVAFAIGFIKGKSAVRIHGQILGNRKVTGLHFRNRGYCVNTVGLDEETMKKYIRDQESLEKRQGELEFDK